MVSPCFVVKPHSDKSLVTEPQICVYCDSLCFAVFLSGELDLCVHLICWIFSTMSSHVFQQGVLESIWILLSFLGFASILSASVLGGLTPLCWHRRPRLASSQSAASRVCGSFLEWIIGIFHNTEACFDPLHFLSGWRRWEV